MNIYFMYWIIIQYDFIYFSIQIVSVLAIGRSFIWILYLFDTSLSLWDFFPFEHFFLSDIKRCIRFILCVICSIPRISHLFKETWFHLWIMTSILVNKGEFIITDLLTQQAIRCVWTKVHIYTYIKYIYMQPICTYIS